MPVFTLVAATLIASSLLAGAVAPATDEPVLRQGGPFRIPELRLLHKVDPEYPSDALQLRIEGTVRFEATIGKDGHIERLRLISGHPVLVRAAKDAAQQWIYRPTLVHHEPVRVITLIDVCFQLDQCGKPLKKHDRGASRSVA